MKKIILIILLCFEIFTIGTVYSNSITDEISKELLRMHILANSNSEYDQNVKINVRDFVLKYIDKNNLQTKQDVIYSIGNLKSEINDFLLENNIEYKAMVLTGYSQFTTKDYNNISIPNGIYNSLKIILGNGEGENWWCVSYPSLLFTADVMGKISYMGELKLKNTLNSETYNIIKKNNIEYKIKFKTVEIINSIFKND